MGEFSTLVEELSHGGFKKQTLITDSTMTAKFVALASCSKEAEWLKNLLMEIPIWPKLMSHISLHCDS